MSGDVLKEKLAAYFAEPERRSFEVRRELRAGEISLEQGVSFELKAPGIPGTALDELRTVLKCRRIPQAKPGIPLLLEAETDLAFEEFLLDVRPAGIKLAAADTEGFRRGLYFLSGMLENAPGPYLKCGKYRRRPMVRNRLSRSFYGPTHRPPFDIDELMDDVDYYPEPYLNRLAKEGINALWLTVCFHEVTFSSIQPPDPFREKRLAKLRRVVERCARYGIRIFLFCIEPQGFVGRPPLLEKHPVLGGITNWGFDMTGFCPTSETARKHLYEQTKNLFASVRGLGGLLDITSGEQLSSCFHNPVPGYSCPRCSKLTPPEILRNVLDPMVRGMKEAEPEAEFISWFYHSSPGKECSAWVYESAAAVPEGVVDLYNFESGIALKQQGLLLHGGDYWNSKTGPAHRFRKLSRLLEKKHVRCGAKLQISNGHELATVPVIPAPGILYGKYKYITGHHVDTVMYSWYFGACPGLMNRAAFELACWDFSRSEKEFLLDLAEREWGDDAPAVAAAWEYFSRGYRKYPLCTDIQYNGPFHHGIVWPLYPEVRFHDLYASWKPLPVSGDSFGKCLGVFTLEEFERQARSMAATYGRGLKLLLPLASKYRKDPHLMREIRYAHAVGLLLESGWRIGRFYLLRKKLYEGDLAVLDEMEEIVRREIAAAEEMIRLCREEFLLGYHSESENWKFTPEELAGRIGQLEQTLKETFPDLRRRLERGEKPRFPEGSFALTCRPGELHRQKTFEWRMTANGRSVHFSVRCRKLENASADRIYFIFCDELYSSMPQAVFFSDSGFMPRNNRFVHPEKIRFSKNKEGWQAGFTFPRSQLEPRPTFNIFRQSMVDGKVVVDSWYPEPGVISLGSSPEVMRSAAMGRLLLPGSKGAGKLPGKAQ